MLDARLNMNQQCALVANKANRVLGCITRSMGSTVRKKLSPLCCTGKNSPEIPCPILGPQFTRDINEIARICKVNGQVGQQPTAHKPTELTEAGRISVGEG